MAGAVLQQRWYRNQESMFTILGGGIVVTLLFWPLLNSIFCLALFGYWLFFAKKVFDIRSFRGKLVILFCLPYLLLLLGIIYSTDIKEAVFKLQQKSPLLILPLVLGTTPAVTEFVKNRIFKILCWATLAGGLVCVLKALFVFFKTGTTSGLYGYPIVILKDMHPVVLGLCCILSLVFLFEGWYVSRKHQPLSYPWGEIFMAGFFVVFLLLIGNRSNLISLVAVMLFYSFRLIQKMQHRILIVTSLVIMLVLTVLINPSLRRQWNDLTDFSEKNTIDLTKEQDPNYNYGGKTIRLTIWKCSVDIIRENLLTGVGTGDVYDALAEAYRKRNFNAAAGHREYNAHNQFLQETIAYGISGFLALFLCITVPFVYYLRRRENHVYMVFLLLFAFVCLTEGFLELNKGIVWYSFFNALLAFTPFNKQVMKDTSLTNASLRADR